MITGENPVDPLGAFQSALVSAMQAALVGQVNPMMLIAILEAQKLDLYQRMLEAAKANARKNIVRASMLPPPPNGR